MKPFSKYSTDLIVSKRINQKTCSHCIYISYYNYRVVLYGIVFGAVMVNKLTTSAICFVPCSGIPGAVSSEVLEGSSPQ